MELVASRQGDLGLCQTTNDAERSNAQTKFLHPFLTEREPFLAKPAGVSSFICLGETRHSKALVSVVHKN